ncbi:hypothetical protein MAR_022813 [Mya arenaria]|uniref:Uncharacterized protein n=1 Tax=Mya arenaria TaxID=6604 RepID=A0ABY7DQ05_MYAAR|nr:hypothetical protein MAR_022813 [Mya arenaria]
MQPVAYQPSPLIKKKGSSVYMSDDNSVTYREECTEEKPKNDVSGNGRHINVTKRALNDDLVGSRVAKILYFVDKAFMNEYEFMFKDKGEKAMMFCYRFLPLGEDDYEATKVIVQDFLTLLTNQVTVSYQSLRQYNKRLYRGEAFYDQDVAIQLVGIEYPPEICYAETCQSKKICNTKPCVCKGF